MTMGITHWLVFGGRRNLSAGKRLKMLAKPNLAEPAEPFPMYFIQLYNYKKNIGKPVGDRFRRFRLKAFLQSLWQQVPRVPLYPSEMAEKAMRHDPVPRAA